MPGFHYALTKMAIALGPSNPFIGFMLQQRCRRFGCELYVHESFIELRKGRNSMLLAPGHFVYTLDLARRFEAYFEPVVSAYRNGYWTVDYSRPGLHTYCRSGLQFHLAAFPEEEDALDGYFHWYTPQPGDCVFDIGAHCGVSTYYFSKLVGPTGRVIAFEPDSRNYSLLLRNIERHNLSNVVPVRVALSNQRGKAIFHREGSLGSCLSKISTRATVGSVEVVETLTLADAYAKWGTPNFCKIDIEGSEIEVIECAGEFLPKQKTNFAVDTNHLVQGVFTGRRLEQLFGSYGFAAESAEVGGFLTTWARPSASKAA